MTAHTAAYVANSLRNAALETDGDYFAILNDAAYIVEAASAAIGWLRNAKIDLETGAPKKTAIRTIEGGIAMLERVFSEAEREAA